MSNVPSKYGFNFAFFDILGFGDKISKPGGLELIKDVYIKLTEIINEHNETYHKLKTIMPTGVYGTSDGAYTLYEVNILYGSDSIFVWSDRTWEELKMVNNDVSKIFHATPYFGKPRICDPFLDICNELICKALELGFMLRGAMSMGEGYFDFSKHIFLGKPIVDAVKLEGIQELVGASFHLTFEEQKIPNRFRIKFNNYIPDYKHGRKTEKETKTNEYVLDWPRHWRNTRDTDLADVINNIDFASQSVKKANTLRLITESNKYSTMYESDDDRNVYNVYPEIYSKTDGVMLRLIDDNGNVLIL